MSFEELVTWIRLGRIRTSHIQSVLPLVEAAFGDVSEDDLRYGPLVEIENALLDATMPEELLVRLADRFPPASVDSPVGDEERLEVEFREVAANLTDPQWRTPHYRNLEACLVDPDADWELTLQTLRKALDGAWLAYSGDYASIARSTAETVVGHRLLSQGYHQWLEALELAHNDAETDEILRVAEGANRLLVAVGLLHARVQMQARSLGPWPPP